jgi:hypothetical protein
MTEPPAEGAEDALASVVEPLRIDVANEHPMVARCFDPDSLAVLAGIRTQLSLGVGGDWTPWLTWALLATLRDVASVAVGWPYQRPGRPRRPGHRDVRMRFSQRFNEMLTDIQGLVGTVRDGVVLEGDARDVESWRRALEGELATASVSSPPYLNNFDYADATRLEVYFLGEAASWRELCERFRQKMLVATTQQTSVRQRREDLEAIRAWGHGGDQIAEIVARLGEERSRRPRGKEYDAAVAGYFIGITKVLENLRDALKRRARVAWVIGDSAPYGLYIDTPALIGTLAEHIGFSTLEDRRLRDRGRRWRTNGTRHQVELAERLLVLRNR